MFPIDIPPGTTLESLFMQVLPESHARFVPESAPKDELRVLAHVEGGVTYEIVVRGRDVVVRESAAGAKPAVLWISFARSSGQALLDDLLGAKRLIPKATPPGGAMVMLTDPRILKRLMMVSGRLEIAIADFNGARLSLVVGAGDAAKKGALGQSPDVTIEAKMTTVDLVLAGKIPPDEVLSGGHVTITGKSFVAMQFAFAVAPFFPVLAT